MKPAAAVAPIVLVLVLARWGMELWLARLNQRQVLANAGTVPPAYQGTVDATTYAKSVAYTLAKNRFSRIETTYDTAILLLVLFSGLLPRAFNAFDTGLGGSVWALAAFLWVSGFALSLSGLPFSWYAQFRLEERFGFNTTTAKTWWLDRLKGFLLAMLLGYPMLVLILKIVSWTGTGWWLWTWGCLLGFQLLMVVLAPVLILPMFNKFTPLPEGGLRDRLLALADRTGFRANSIQVMDGSKRSRHSNAFFTGFGRFRKIVLFDTLIAQLAEPELEVVLAHEIGHYKKNHIPKLLIGFAAGMLVGLFAVAWLAEQAWFYHAFGFELGSLVPALLLFSLLSGVVTFWFSPLQNLWSRRYEFQADAYAATAMGETTSLIGALRKLNIKNLSNLTPHPWYSGFYYSHPTLLEREAALAGLIT